VSPLVRTEDLVDAQAVTKLLGIRQRNSVSGYQRRYPAMPRPIMDLGLGQPELWLRQEVEHWLQRRNDTGRGYVL
jgi:hypothetical protein